MVDDFRLLHKSHMWMFIPIITTAPVSTFDDPARPSDPVCVLSVTKRSRRCFVEIEKVINAAECAVIVNSNASVAYDFLLLIVLLLGRRTQPG